MQGVSLKPVFEGTRIIRAKPLYWEHQGNRAIRMGKWKLVAKGSFGVWELFDLESDRSELNDLAGLYPNRVTEMSQKWEEWAIESHVKPWPWKQKKNKSKGKKKK